MLIVFTHDKHATGWLAERDRSKSCAWTCVRGVGISLNLDHSESDLTDHERKPLKKKKNWVAYTIAPIYFLHTWSLKFNSPGKTVGTDQKAKYYYGFNVTCSMPDRSKSNWGETKRVQSKPHWALLAKTDWLPHLQERQEFTNLAGKVHKCSLQLPESC